MKLPDEIREYFQRKGASGGRKRARNLSPEQRSEIARKASQARWNKKASGKKTNQGEDKQ